MVKEVATSIITVAALMGSLIACSGSDSEVAQLRAELEELKKEQSQETANTPSSSPAPTPSPSPTPTPRPLTQVDFVENFKSDMENGSCMDPADLRKYETKFSSSGDIGTSVEFETASKLIEFCNHLVLLNGWLQETDDRIYITSNFRSCENEAMISLSAFPSLQSAIDPFILDCIAINVGQMSGSLGVASSYQGFGNLEDLNYATPLGTSHVGFHVPTSNLVCKAHTGILDLGDTYIVFGETEGCQFSTHLAVNDFGVVVPAIIPIQCGTKCSPATIYDGFVLPDVVDSRTIRLQDEMDSPGDLPSPETAKFFPVNGFRVLDVTNNNLIDIKRHMAETKFLVYGFKDENLRIDEVMAVGEPLYMTNEGEEDTCSQYQTGSPIAGDRKFLDIWEIDAVPNTWCPDLTGILTVAYNFLEPGYRSGKQFEDSNNCKVDSTDEYPLTQYTSEFYWRELYDLYGMCMTNGVSIAESDDPRLEGLTGLSDDCLTWSLDQIKRSPERKCVGAYMIVFQFDQLTGSCSFLGKIANNQDQRYDSQKTELVWVDGYSNAIDGACTIDAAVDEGDKIRASLVSAGEYSYVTDLGTTRSVPKFIATRVVEFEES